jgi:nifR3 family TIM-barrel protein
MNLHQPIRIGSATTQGNLFLGPVAGYSDAAFRSICTDLGCDLAFTEMVSSEALTRNSVKTAILLERAENEKQFAVQLFGGNPDTMARAAAIVEERWQPLLLDINCGCPVPKIIKTGAGAALMREPARIAAIVVAIKNVVHTPVTVKIRLGWDDYSINYLDAAKAAVDAGAAAVTLHARTRAQGYAGQADRQAFFKLAAAIAVPVIASGDMHSAEDAFAVLSGSGAVLSGSGAVLSGGGAVLSGSGAVLSGGGIVSSRQKMKRPDHNTDISSYNKVQSDQVTYKPVAGIMFARGAMGDPFIFARTRALLHNEPEPVIAMTDRLAAAKRHFSLSLRFYDERSACVEFRKQACCYLKGVPGGGELRARAVACRTAQEYAVFFSLWEQWSNRHPQDRTD